MEIAQQARSLCQILTRRRENETGPFSGGGDKRERTAFAGPPGACTSARSEVASPGLRPRWQEPWGCGDRGSVPDSLGAFCNAVHGPGQFSIQGAKGGKTVTDEILLIVLAGAWLFVHVIAHGLTQWAAAGNTWAFGARDDPPRETLLRHVRCGFFLARVAGRVRADIVCLILPGEQNPPIPCKIGTMREHGREGGRRVASAGSRPGRSAM